ncbi:MAG: FadR family transcriptional regulator [Peptococcaceae bacterium]|nr:FadR family transcriptional regulator [Peptococcaceae bacterium]
MPKYIRRQTSKEEGATILENLVRKNLSDEISDYIIDKIKDGTFNVGEKLPSETELSKMLGVSRGSLREAIKKLCFIGLLEIRRGDGTFVREGSIREIVDCVEAILRKDTNSLKDFLVARIYIERGIVVLATENATSGDLVKLKSNILEMGLCVQNNDNSTFSHLDELFHFKLAEMAGNNILQKVMEMIRGMLQNQQQYINTLPGIIKTSYTYHQRISKMPGKKES